MGLLPRPVKYPMPKTTDDDDDRQDDPKEAAEIERLRAKLARHKREAERLAEALRQMQKKK
jgi:hypothetical protein